MAQQELRIVVKADGTATVTRQLDKVNDSINKIDASKKKLSLGKDFLGGMVSGALTAAAAFISVRAAMNTANRALNEFTNSFATMQELQNVLNSTGRAAEFTTSQLTDMASEIMVMTGIGDDDILKGATMGLLRFDSVTKDIFPRAQRLAIDMSKSFGGIEGATKALGLALADPIMGMNKMKRAGAEFTDQQRELIKSLMETGDKAAAQSVLMRILESDYHNAAMAGVTGATMLKTAWGEYLETLGGSISAFDGVKRGLAQFFLDVAQNSQNLSQAQMKHILDVQERWAIATLEISQRGKQIITIMGGTAVSVFGILNDLLKGIYMSFNNVYGAFVDVYNGIGSIAPRFMEAITGVSTFKQAFNDLKDDFSAGSEYMTGIDAFGAETQKNLKNWIATFTNANAAIQSGKEDLIEFYNAQRKLVESGKNPFTGADIAEGEDAGALLKQIDKNQSQATERLRDMQGEMLSAWSTYYTTLDQYSNESIQAQADLYKYQLQQQYGTILSMQQIDEMYNAKLWELRDAQLAHFAEGYEEMPEIVEESMSKIATIMQESAADIQRSGFNLLNNSIYDLISGTNSLKDVWANAWAAMQEIALRAMAEIISKMMVTAIWQQILGMVGGSSLFASSGLTMPSPGVWTQPVPIPTMSTGGGLGSLPTGGNSGSILSELRSLRMAITDNREQNFNLYMDGVPLRNALNRVEKRLNYLGANT